MRTALCMTFLRWEVVVRILPTTLILKLSALHDHSLPINKLCKLKTTDIWFEMKAHG